MFEACTPSSTWIKAVWAAACEAHTARTAAQAAEREKNLIENSLDVFFESIDPAQCVAVRPGS